MKQKEMITRSKKILKIYNANKTESNSKDSYVSNNKVITTNNGPLRLENGKLFIKELKTVRPFNDCSASSFTVEEHQ